MGLIKVKNPVEYSFHQWMSGYPESTHWLDSKRFYCFVKTVCRFNASKWKNVEYLKHMILEYHPNFDADKLGNIEDLFLILVDFSNVLSIRSGYQISDRSVPKNHYIELSIRNKNVKESVLQLEL